MSETEPTKEKLNSFAKWIGRGLAVLLFVIAVMIGLFALGESSSTSSNNASQGLY